MTTQNQLIIILIFIIIVVAAFWFFWDYQKMDRQYQGCLNDCRMYGGFPEMFEGCKRECTIKYKHWLF